MSATATFLHPSMSSMHGHPWPPSFPHSNSPFNAASRHTNLYSQPPFQSSPQMPHQLQQQQQHVSSSSSPFPAWPNASSAAPLPPPLQQQRVSSSSSSPFLGWANGSSAVPQPAPLQQQRVSSSITASPFGWANGSSSVPPPAPAQAARGQSSFRQPPSHSQQHSQMPLSQQPPSSFPPPMPQSGPQVPPPQSLVQPYSHGAYAQSQYGLPPRQPEPPEHNTTEMTRDMVLQVLNKFSEELPYYFDLEDTDDASYGGNGSSGDERSQRRRREGYPASSSRSKPSAIRLTVHGGASMLLHPGFHALSLKVPEVPQQNPLTSSRQSPPDASRTYPDPTYVGPRPTQTMRDLARRTSTRDVDIILRGFVADFGNLGPPPRDRRRRHEGGPRMELEEDISRMDAATRLKACIKATARHFSGLGQDWMNAEADVSLPLAKDPTTHQTYDPIHISTWTDNNTHLYTLYTSPNKRLVLTSVPPYWLLALKISRWGPRDWVDVGIVLRYGTLVSRTLFGNDIVWTGDMVKKFLEKECWPMGYQTQRYDAGKRGEFVMRCENAAALVNGWEEGVPVGWPARYLDRSLLEGAVQTGHSQVSGVAPDAQPQFPPATLPPPPLPPEEHTENVRDWVRRSQSQLRRSSSSRRRSSSKARLRRREEEEEERFRRDGPFVPPGVEFDQDGYAVANQYREKHEERRGRAGSPRTDERPRPAYADPYAGPSRPYTVQQSHPRDLTRGDIAPVHSSWITDEMARARISSPVQDINHIGPVDPSLASLAWHPRARDTAIHIAAPAIASNLGAEVHSSNAPYRQQPSSYNQTSVGYNDQSQDRQRSMRSGPSSREELRAGAQVDHVDGRDRAWGDQPWREHTGPEPDSDSEDEDAEGGSDADSGGRNAGSESDDYESDSGGRGRSSYAFAPRQTRADDRSRVYASPTPHTAPTTSRGASIPSGIEGSLLLQPASTHLPLSTISGRNVRRSLSPNPSKHRPPPLNISPPPEPLAGSSNLDADRIQGNFYPSSTNVHPAYFRGNYNDSDPRRLEPVAGSSRVPARRSQSRPPSPNPPHPAHAQAPPVMPPAHHVYGHSRQRPVQVQPEPPSLSRAARAAQLQFEEQKTQWEQEQRWMQQRESRRMGWL